MCHLQELGIRLGDLAQFSCLPKKLCQGVRCVKGAVMERIVLYYSYK